MALDFNIVKRQIIQEYIRLYGTDNEGRPWSLEDYLKLFRYYYDTYQRNTGQNHPKLSNKTIREIIEQMPYLDNNYHDCIDLTPEEYVVLIDAYFKQHFDNCDYSIAHFMAGDIRTLRYYEEIY